ncbi:hypothetical protein ACVI1I_007073 [Bradyrhizobium sp. USDA 4459]
MAKSRPLRLESWKAGAPDHSLFVNLRVRPLTEWAAPIYDHPGTVDRLIFVSRRRFSR